MIFGLITRKELREYKKEQSHRNEDFRERLWKLENPPKFKVGDSIIDRGYDTHITAKILEVEVWARYYPSFDKEYYWQYTTIENCDKLGSFTSDGDGAWELSKKKKG